MGPGKGGRSNPARVSPQRTQVTVLGIGPHERSADAKSIPKTQFVGERFVGSSVRRFVGSSASDRRSTLPERAAPTSQKGTPAFAGVPSVHRQTDKSQPSGGSVHRVLVVAQGGRPVVA